MIKILAYIVYGVGIVLTVIWLLGIRVHTKTGQGVAATTVNITMLFIVSLALVPLLELSPFHLLWFFPVSVVLGMLSGSFPFSLLSYPGRVIWRLACVGLDIRCGTQRGIYGMSRDEFDRTIDEIGHAE